MASVDWHFYIGTKLSAYICFYNVHVRFRYPYNTDDAQCIKLYSSCTRPVAYFALSAEGG